MIISPQDNSPLSPKEASQQELSTQLSEQINLFFKNGNPSTSNVFLNNYISLPNLPLFIQLLFQSQNNYLKFYSAEALIKLFKDNFLSISSQTTVDLYKGLLQHIVYISINLFSLLNQRTTSKMLHIY